MNLPRSASMCTGRSLSKCPYCDFNSHVRRAAIDEPRFVGAFTAEIAATAARAPAALSPRSSLAAARRRSCSPKPLRQCSTRSRRHWRIAPDAEISLEANPTSVEAERFRGYRSAGVNRVSLGVQALDDRVLAELGRLHTAKEALAAVAVARQTFARYSFDLIYARPQQTSQDWAKELKLALAEAGDHLSLYQLTIEPETPFAALHAAGKLKTPDDDTARALYDTTQEVCAAHGLPAYEISNHARSGGECRHNLVYWRANEYAGVGPGAHGRLDIDGDRHATATEKRPEAWLEQVERTGHGLVTDELLTREEASDEFLLMGLRLTEGIDVGRYVALSGRPLDPERLAALRDAGLIENVSPDRLRVTLPGFPILDAVVADLAA